MALSMLVLLSAVVADLSYRESIRYKLAVHHRDALQAQALAAGGIEFARLILVVQPKLQSYLNAASRLGMPLPAPVVWQLIPLHSDLFKGLVSGDLLTSLGMDVSEALQNRQQKESEGDSVKNPQAFVKPKGGFGAFHGSFSVEIVDEESKISLRPWAAQTTVTKLKKAVADKLYALFSPARYDDLFRSQAGATSVDRWSLVGNLYDYTQSGDRRIDPQAPEKIWGRPTGGSKSSLYTSTSHVEPKRAYFDSQRELMLVPGMTDAHMSAFGDAVTIYGGDQEGKVNILTASDQVVEALIRYCAKRPDDARLRSKDVIIELLKQWQEHRMGKDKKQASPTAFVGFLQEQKIEIDPEKCANSVTDQSGVFTIRSAATVGAVTKRLTLVARVFRNVEDNYYFSVQ